VCKVHTVDVDLGSDSGAIFAGPLLREKAWIEDDNTRMAMATDAMGWLVVVSAVLGVSAAIVILLADAKVGVRVVR